MHVGPEPPPPDGSPASESMRQKHVGLKRQFSAGVSLSSLESHVLPGLHRLICDLSEQRGEAGDLTGGEAERENELVHRD